jgi:hypothetical protein
MDADTIEILELVVFVAVILAGQLAWRGYRSRVVGGRFSAVTSASGPGLETELGTFWVDEGTGKLWIRRPGGSPSFVWLRDIERVHVSASSKETPFEEFVLEGWRLTDFMRRYRDYRGHWEISLLTKHSPVVIAELEQYKKRDFFDVATPVQHWILARLGYYREAEAVVAELQATLGALVITPAIRAKASARATEDEPALDLPLTSDGPGPRWR